MILDQGAEESYQGFEPSAFPGVSSDPAGSLDQPTAPGVAPAPYSEEFAGSFGPFGQQPVTDSSFQPQLADTPNPSGIPVWALALGLGALALFFGGKHR